MSETLQPDNEYNPNLTRRLVDIAVRKGKALAIPEGLFEQLDQYGDSGLVIYLEEQCGAGVLPYDTRLGTIYTDLTTVLDGAIEQVAEVAVFNEGAGNVRQQQAYGHIIGMAHIEASFVAPLNHLVTGMPVREQLGSSGRFPMANMHASYDLYSSGMIDARVQNFSAVKCLTADGCREATEYVAGVYRSLTGSDVSNALQNEPNLMYAAIAESGHLLPADQCRETAGYLIRNLL